MIALQYPPPPDVPPGPDRVFAYFYLFALALAIVVILLLPREWTRRIARIALNRERDE